LFRGRSEFKSHTDLSAIAEHEAKVKKRLSTYKTFAIRGKKQADVCSGSETVEVPSGHAKAIHAEGLVWVSQEVVYDEPNCLSEYEGAWLTPEGASAAGFDLGLDDAEPQSTAPSLTESSATVAAATWSWDGRMKGYVVEPAQIEVVTATSRIRWSSNGCAIDSARNAYWGTFLLTWSLVEAWNSGFGTGCSVGWSAHGKWKSGFCLSIDTWAHIDVSFEAYPGGISVGKKEVSKWGGCSGLLRTSGYYDPN